MAIERDAEHLRGLAKKQEVIDDARYVMGYHKMYCAERLHADKPVVHRRYYAAARMQGLIRGFLSRLNTKIKRAEYRAALRIQKILRGRQGKKRWLDEFWRSEAVVKTPSALEVSKPCPPRADCSRCICCCSS